MNYQDPSVLWKATDAEYYGDFSAISNSMCSVALKSMRLYEGLFVTRTIEPEPPSPEMLIGSLVHCMILEPDQVIDRYLIATCDTRRGKIWDHALEQAARHCKVAVTEPVFETAKHVANAVLGDPDAARLIHAANLIEQPLRWTDRDTGLVRKAKLDAAIVGDVTNLVVDVKTTHNPDPGPFTHSALEYGYARQAVYYSEALEALTGGPARVLFVCVGKEAPWDVAINECEPKLLDLARMELRDVLARIAVAMEERVWLSPWQRQINQMQAPGWAMKQAGIV